METVTFKATIEDVIPKKGKGDKIVIRLETSYSQETLMALADAMMLTDEEERPVVSVQYEPLPLFTETEAQDYLDLEE